MRDMLEFYSQGRKRWKDRATTKRRRALLNRLMVEDAEWAGSYMKSITRGQPPWNDKYIRSIRRAWKWCRGSISPFDRYLNKQVGKDAGEVYSDLSQRPIYRQERYLLKEAFMREMQYEWDYRRDDDGRIHLIRNTYCKQSSPLPLRAYNTGFEGRWFAKYLVWYPSHKSTRIVIDIGSPPITGHLWAGKGWYGYYIHTEEVYKQELLLDEQGSPLFTKQEYEIHNNYGDRKVIPIGGPLLRETVTTITRSEWKHLGDVWDWDMRAYARSEGELQRLKQELHKSYEGG